MGHAPTARSVTVRVPAKVNLELRVGPRRADGFHDLATIYQAVSLYDEVTVTPAAVWSVEVTGPDAQLVPTGDSNLALRAARMLSRTSGGSPVAISIAKAIPVAGGMAGGSADAAATLVACDALWELETGRPKLERLAARLGSDVPFLLDGGTSIGSGRGELVAPVLAPEGLLHWVLVTSQPGLSTPSVFAELDRLRGEAATTWAAPEVTAGLMVALRRGDVDQVASCLANDLTEPALALRPDLAQVISAGKAYGAMAALLSGSGPTVAFLVPDVEAGLDLSIGLAAQKVGHGVHRAHGPVPGASVTQITRA